MKAIKVHSYTFGPTVMIDEEGRLQLIQKATVISREPAEITKHENEVAQATAMDKDDLASRMLAGGGIAHRVEITGELRMILSGRAKIEATHLNLLVDNTDYIHAQSYAAASAARLLFGDDVGLEEVDAEEVARSLRETAAATAHLMPPTETALGNEVLSMLEEMLGKVRDAEASSSRADVAPYYAGPGLVGQIEKFNPDVPVERVHDADSVRYAPVAVTDFEMSAVPRGPSTLAQGRHRLLHIGEPTWHDHLEPGELKSLGYIGYWLYDKAALAAFDGNSVEYAVASNMQVFVKNRGAADPGGHLAVPEPVYAAMGGPTPVKWLSLAESDEFNRRNAQPMSARGTSSTLN